MKENLNSHLVMKNYHDATNRAMMCHINYANEVSSTLELSGSCHHSTSGSNKVQQRYSQWGASNQF